MGNSKLKLGLLTSYITLFLNNILGLLFTPFLIDSLGKAQYGVFSLIGTLVGFVLLLDLGFSNAIVRYVARYRAEKDRESESLIISTCLYIYSGISIIVVIIGVFLFTHIENIFNQGLSPEELGVAKDILLIHIFNLMFTFPINAFAGVMRGYEKFTVLNVSSMVRALVRICILYVLLSLGFKAVTVVLVDTILNILIGLINVSYVLFVLKVRLIVPRSSGKTVVSFFQNSSFLFLIALAGQTVWQVGNVMLGMYTSAVSVAVYSIALQFPTYYMNIANNISTIFVPRISMMEANNASEKETAEFLIRTTRLQFIIIGFVLGGFVIFGKSFISLWLGTDYIQVWILAIILMVPQTFSLLLSIPGCVLIAKNRHSFKALAAITNAVLITVLIYFLIKKHDIYGVAFSTALGIIISEVVIMTIYYHLRMNINMLRFWWEGFILLLPFVVVSSLLTGVLTIIFPPNSWETLFIEGCTYSIIYLVLFFLFGANYYEKNIIKSIFTSIFNRFKVSAKLGSGRKFKP